MTWAVGMAGREAREEGRLDNTHTLTVAKRRNQFVGVGLEGWMCWHTLGAHAAVLGGCSILHEAAVTVIIENHSDSNSVKEEAKRKKNSNPRYLRTSHQEIN